MRGALTPALRPFSIVFAATLSACAGASSTRPPAPAPASPVERLPRPIPPVPRVVGAIDVRIVYPRDGAAITARDSNFVFGSLGSGDATLSIDGHAVPVLPNGSFLAFLPVPEAGRSAYEIVAARGRDTVRLTHRVRVPAPRPGVVLVDSASLSPGSSRVLRADEPVRVSLRAAPGAEVWLELATSERRELRAAVGAGVDPWLRATDVPARALRTGGVAVAARGSDTVRLRLAPVLAIDSLGAQFAVIGLTPTTLPDTDRVISARPVAGGTYKWFVLPGTVLELTGRVGAMVRVRLDSRLEAWIDSGEVNALPPGTAAPSRVAANARVVESAEWSDLVIPMTDRPAWSVADVSGGLELTLYDTRANTDIINYRGARSDPDPVFLERVDWEQEATDRARYRLVFAEPVFGWLVSWRNGALVLRVRRAPRIALDRPLAGLTIAVDAGHPPAGSTGPTGLYEAVATLNVAQRLASHLEARGAKVVMTRTGPSALGLVERTVIARRADAHAFVSIHLNALPDGVNPFNVHGTGTYYFTPHSEPLARFVQTGMVRYMGLRDLGVNYDNLAVLRPSWMPAVLCEGAFIMIPEHEAALRTAEFQDAYASGVTEGLERYFSSLRGATRIR